MNTQTTTFNQLKPAVRIGKNGITDSTIDEILKILKKKKTIKVKFLNSFMDGKVKKEVFEEVAKKTGSKLLQSRGFTIVLHKDVN